MDSVLDLWQEKGVDHVFSTMSSYFGIYKNMNFTKSQDEKHAFSMAFGLTKTNKNIFVGVCLDNPPTIPFWPIQILVYYPGCKRDVSGEEENLENVRQQLKASLRTCIVFGEMEDNLLSPELLQLKIPLLAIPETMGEFAGIPDSFFGRIGIFGDLSGNMILQNADLVFLIGRVRLENADCSWFVREGHVIHIGHISPDLPCHGFVKSARSLLPFLKEKQVLGDWKKKCSEWRDKWIHLFPPEEIFAVKEGIDPYMFFASFHQMWEEKDMMIVQDKWFQPAFQQAVLPSKNHFIPVPTFLEPYTVVKQFLNYNQEQPMFLFTGQSLFQQKDLTDLEHNPLPLVVVLMRDAKEPISLDFSGCDLEVFFLNSSGFSPESFLVETLPLVLVVEMTEDFVPYPRGGIPFENMSPFEASKYDMIIPPYI